MEKWTRRFMKIFFLSIFIFYFYFFFVRHIIFHMVAINIDATMAGDF